MNKVAQDYGINAQTIRNWVKEAEVKKDLVNSRVAELEAQLREERKKSSDLEQTVNILKNSWPSSFKTTGSRLCFHQETQL